MILDKLTFYVDGDPFGKQRPRVLKTGRAYTPTETVNYEKRVLMCFRAASRGRFYADKDTPVSIAITAYYKIPKSTPKKKCALMIAGKLRPLKKPDWDNIGKVISDALNGQAYADDKQVVDARVTKWYTVGEPCVVVNIRKELSNEQRENT